MKKNFYITSIFFLSLFILGGYFWKISRSGGKGQQTNAEKSFEDLSEITVFVNDQPVSEEELNFEMKVHASLLDELNQKSQKKVENKKDKEVVLEKLKDSLIGSIVERRVLYFDLQNNPRFDHDSPSRVAACQAQFEQTKKSLGKTYTEKEFKYLKQRLCQVSLISQYSEEVIFRDLQVEEEEIKSYYKEHLDEFKVGQRVLLRQIVLASEEEAKKIQAIANPQNFGTLARQHSISPESKDGGLLGPFSADQIPQVFDIAFTLNVGSIYGILKSPYGFHLILLLKKWPKAVLSLEEARNQINKTLMEVKRQEEFQKWVETASKSAKIRMSRAE